MPMCTLCVQATTRNDVIIMELCAGGSLYNVLEKPENYYGLEETEFLRFVKDLSNQLNSFTSLYSSRHATCY